MSEPEEPPLVPAAPWTAEGVRDLRSYLGLSQEGLARRLGTRQQTISEWETGARAPRGMSRHLLRLVAEESGFYTVDSDATTGANSERSDDLA